MLVDGMDVDVWVGAAVCETVYFWEHKTALSLEVVAVYEARDNGWCALWCAADLLVSFFLLGRE